MFPAFIRKILNDPLQTLLCSASNSFLTGNRFFPSGVTKVISKSWLLLSGARMPVAVVVRIYKIPLLHSSLFSCSFKSSRPNVFHQQLSAIRVSWPTSITALSFAKPTPIFRRISQAELAKDLKSAICERRTAEG